MKSKTLTLAVALAVLAPSAYAASGTFTFVTGEVSLTKKNGQRIPAVRGIEVDPGDLIATGSAGMAQLSMIDQARLSLRPNSQFRIEGYQDSPTSTATGVLNLLRGTLRTFTGLIATTNRDKFVMKTRVATVGIRGSGNILYACSVADGDCDAAAVAAGGTGDITINHTIEGSHAITNDIPGSVPGTPAQQGGAQTLITGPGQTVLVTGNQPPKYIPTPQFIADTATNPANAKSTTGGTNTDTRNFAPGDNQQLTGGNQNTTTPVGNNGLGFVTIDASSNLLSDPVNLRDIVIASNGPFLGQATQADVTLDGAALRGYTAYPGSLSNLRPDINGNPMADVQSVSLGGGGSIVLGRYVNGTLGFSGPGSGSAVGGNVHWIYAPSGYPGYVSDVLTGTAVYTLAAATSPTNQNGTPGSFGTATLNVNFSNRTLSLGLAFSIPSAGGNPGGSWTAQANNVPLALNSFYASTSDRLVITNQFNISSATNSLLIGSVEGSFVGSNLQGAILGYGITDLTDPNSNNNNSVTGVVAFTGPAQNGAAPFREGRISDPAGRLGAQDYSRNYATTNRPDEVTADATGRVTSFVGPASGIGNRATYALGSAQVVQAGFDAETGLVWGRWGGGVAQVSGNGQNGTLDLQNSSLHYIFAGSQAGPVTLPLTGTASYDVIGNTAPTNSGGAVGTLGSATLDANFTNRTVSSTVNVNIAGQNWIGTAPSMPIYRDMYFTASTGSSIPGAPNVSTLTLTCTPNCGQNAIGSFDGFFTGRTGQRAGMLYNMGGVQGAVAFGRRGG